MLHLVIWTDEDPPTTSIVRDKDFKDLRKGAKARAGGGWFEAKLVRSSSLEVDESGQIMTSKKKSKRPDFILLQRREELRENRQVESAKSASSVQTESLISTKKSIMSDSSGDESVPDTTIALSAQAVRVLPSSSVSGSTCHQPVEANSNDDRMEIDTVIEEPADPKERVEDVHGSNGVDPEVPEPEVENVVATSAGLNALADIPPQQQQVGVEIEHAAREEAVEPETDEDDLDEEESYRRSLVSDHKGSGKIQMIKKSNIFIDRAELLHLKEEWRNKPREFARRLLKLVIGPKKLEKMSPTGRGGHIAIPKKTYNAVLRYMNKKCTDPKKRLARKIYRRVLTNFCNGLRNPRSNR
ncbi:hypothetical protein QAD02_020226 [Eretmocerus hayati]|uniref:Uncharacterized protein n=1 Tax=Eretmocerus hayati TaxID=131215 RepID=A0ACC2PMA9_9HYME|nr:hypothetical protein QAD02_020226 [Eretmocerus hayati]